MIHQICSTQLTELAGSLSETLNQSFPENPLTPQTVIVPNLDTARWLRFYLAEKNGIAANLDFVLPSEWMYRQIRRKFPDLPELLPSDIMPMSWSLYWILLDDDARSGFPNLHSYINRQPGGRQELYAWKLARKIASVFDQYIVYRPEMLLSWQNGRKGTGDEHWQSELWRLLNREWARLKDPYLRKNRAELQHQLLKAVRNKELQFDESFFVFNPGLMPVPVLNAFQTAGNQCNLYLYYVQPTEGELPAEDHLSHPLLKSLGREALNIRKTITGILGRNREFIKPNSSSPQGNLQALKRAVLENRQTSETIRPDHTIQIRSCHSALREIETLQQFLLELFEKYEDLHPDDILVATPNPEQYEPLIKAVFDNSEEELPAIPWNIRSSYERGRLAERAFRQLLNLLDSRFSFSAVMDLFSLKPVCESFDVASSDVSVIKQWMEENHVVWGLTGEHRTEWDQPREETQTWMAAMKRGWLGQWMADEPGRLAGDTLLFSDIDSTSKKEIWAAFSRFLHRLDQFRETSKEKQSAEQWHDWLTRLTDQFLTEESKSDRAGLQIASAIDKLRESAAVVHFDREVPFSLIRDEMLALLDSPVSRSAMFTRGITFSSMVPVRSIPFRVIALIGLNEQAFPRKTHSPDFDLMVQNPLDSDRNRKFEDRNLFLESVLAAGDVHYCSYIGQSPVDNETIPPSPIVSEWVDYLSDLYDCSPDEIIQKEALNHFSPSNFRDEKSYSKLHFQMAEQLASGQQNIEGFDFSAELPDEEPVSEIQVNDLVRFFKNPVQWFVQQQLGARLRDADSEKDEFRPDHLEKHLLFQRVFGWLVLQNPAMDTGTIKKLLTESGALPSGWPGEILFREILTNVKTSEKALQKKGIQPVSSVNELFADLAEITVEGEILSYSDRFLLDITPSKFSGSVALQSWIRHLCLQASTNQQQESYLLCNLKGGDPVWHTFKPVKEVNDVLIQLAKLYVRGHQSPLTLFPRTVYAYEEANRSRKKKNPVKQAALEFEGSDYSYAERDDLSISVIMGENIPFRQDFVSEEFRNLFELMMEHMEEA